MLLDGAKGLEPQTRKLFEVCRMRKLPLFTFVNKLDRPALTPYEIMDQIEGACRVGCDVMLILCTSLVVKTFMVLIWNDNTP